MQTHYNAPERDARDIGEKSQDIQNNVTVATAKLTARLIQFILERLQRLNLLRSESPARISIIIGDSRGRTSNMEGNARDATSFDKAPFCTADLEYVEAALGEKAGSGKRSTLDRDLTITLDGKDILVIQDGEVLQNDLYDKERDAPHPSTPIEAEIVGEETGRDTEDPRRPEDETGEREQAPTSTSDPPIVPEVVTDEPKGRDGMRTTGERSPVSPVIVILTREIGRSTRESPARARFFEILNRAGQAPRNVLTHMGASLDRAAARVTSRFRGNPLVGRDRQNLDTCSTAHKLLDRYGQKSGGKDVFEGNLYRFERDAGKSLAIHAKDGRGCVFQQTEGVIHENLTPYDRARFQEIDRRLPSAERSHGQSSRARSTGEQELG